MRGQDLNLRSSGYEPDELPDYSTPRENIMVFNKRLMSNSTLFWQFLHSCVLEVPEDDLSEEDLSINTTNNDYDHKYQITYQSPHFDSNDNKLT